MQALEGILMENFLCRQNKTSIYSLTRHSSRDPRQVFIPFFTTKSEGTGIELNLHKEFIRWHEGHLSIKENIAGKTIFHIELP